MMSTFMTQAVLGAAGLAFLAGCAGGPPRELITAEDFTFDTFQGKYPGKIRIDGVDGERARAILIADGERQYRVVLEYGLHRKNHRAPLVAVPAKDDPDRLRVSGTVGKHYWQGTVLGQTLRIEGPEPSLNRFQGKLEFFSSPSLGSRPVTAVADLLPYGGGDLSTQADYEKAFTNKSWTIQPDGSVLVGKGATLSRQAFGDCQIHLEFRIPYMPKKRGQARGNSGIYIQDRYEVQLLDSFGLESKDNDCGGIYKIAKPRYNACLPPMQWQTYDIKFKAARFNQEGKVIKLPEVTVLHNGVPIHENLKLPSPTAGGKKGHIAKAPFRLQDHHNPMRFRNIWVRELPAPKK